MFKKYLKEIKAQSLYYREGIVGAYIRFFLGFIISAFIFG